MQSQHSVPDLHQMHSFAPFDTTFDAADDGIHCLSLTLRRGLKHFHSWYQACLLLTGFFAGCCSAAFFTALA